MSAPTAEFGRADYREARLLASSTHEAATEAAENVLRQGIKAFLAVFPEIQEMSFEGQYEYNDEGGSYLYIYTNMPEEVSIENAKDRTEAAGLPPYLWENFTGELGWDEESSALLLGIAGEGFKSFTRAELQAL